MKKQTFSLQPFQPTKADLQITGEITRDNNILTVYYRLKGDLEEIEIPTVEKLPIRKNELWETTCFEFFLGIKDAPFYWEFNLSPGGDWNIYFFEDYRHSMQLEDKFESFPFNILRDSNALYLRLEFNLDCLVSIIENLDVSITTVIKSKQGDISYWALKHCGEEADFHLRDSFVFAV
ncbi:MAG: DOMON-like domain-containing protein [Rivularia sp. (in: cyanobacteria)]